jgi:hypothetical protein
MYYHGPSRDFTVFSKLRFAHVNLMAVLYIILNTPSTRIRARKAGAARKAAPFMRYSSDRQDLSLFVNKFRGIQKKVLSKRIKYVTILLRIETVKSWT